MSQPVVKEARIEIVDALRGLASLAVCIGHLMICNHALFPSGKLHFLGDLGHYGVEVFFVISGFVIPFSLWRSKYRPGDFLRFVAKRILRIDPPYICGILLVLLLWWLSALVPGYSGEPFQIRVVPLLLHLAYMNAFTGGDWLLTVYWTLAIEFQYYLLLAAIFPLLAHRFPSWRVVALLAMSAMAFLVPRGNLVFHYWFLFLFGIAAFYYRTGQVSRRNLWPLLAFATIGAGLTLGWAPAGVGLCAALAVSFGVLRHPLLSFLGVISYSLYLTHLPIGGRVVNLGARWVHSDIQKLLLIVLGVTVSIASSWVFYRLIERPAHRWSRSIRYRTQGAISTRPADE